jgi:hypothetical protein
MMCVSELVAAQREETEKVSTCSFHIGEDKHGKMRVQDKMNMPCWYCGRSDEPHPSFRNLVVTGIGFLLGTPS